MFRTGILLGVLLLAVLGMGIYQEQLWEGSHKVEASTKGESSGILIGLTDQSECAEDIIFYVPVKITMSSGASCNITMEIPGYEDPGYNWQKTRETVKSTPELQTMMESIYKSLETE